MTLDEVITTINDCIPNGCISKFGTVMEDINRIREEEGLQFSAEYVIGEAEIDSVTYEFISEFNPLQAFTESELFRLFSLVNTRLCKVYSIAERNGKVIIGVVFI